MTRTMQLNWDDPLAPIRPADDAVTARPELVPPVAAPVAVSEVPAPVPEPALPEPALPELATTTLPDQDIANGTAPQQANGNGVAASIPAIPAQPAASSIRPAFVANPSLAIPPAPAATLHSREPVRAEDKRVINGQADINQLAPFKYPWAWDMFLNANKNHWTPLDINMAQDVHDYHHRLTLEERHVYENVLAYLTTSDILAMRNVGLAVMEKMTAPELQIYQARQVYEEALHTWTYQHCIESIGLDQGEIYNRYRVVPEINQKIQIASRRLNSVMRPDIDLRDPAELQNFLMAYLFFAAVFEGCWFYNGFSPIFALQRRGLMTGTAEQLQYIMRDEVMHCAFGIRTVKQIMLENNVTPDPDELQAMWLEAEQAEADYARYILRDPILGYQADEHIGQFRYMANRRSRQLGLAEPFPGAEVTLGWLDEQANLRKEKNFFETRVTEYQTGGALDWG